MGWGSRACCFVAVVLGAEAMRARGLRDAARARARIGRGAWAPRPDDDARARRMRRCSERAPRRRPGAGRRAPRWRRSGWRRDRAARWPGARARHLRGHCGHDRGCASACAVAVQGSLTARAMLSLNLIRVCDAGCPARTPACLLRWCMPPCSFSHTNRSAIPSCKHGWGPHSTDACGQVQRPGRAGPARMAERPWTCRPR